MKVLIMPRHGAALAAQVCLIAIACGLGTEANAAMIPVTYSLAGAVSSIPVSAGTTLTFDSTSVISVLSGNANLNAVWNPVTSKDHNVVDFTTGLNNATFTWTFADGSSLLGTLLEDVSHVDQAGAGPFTQTFTFTGGTGEFAGANGSVSGAGVGTASGFTSSGSGTINAPAVPEPAPAALLASGLAVLLVAFRRSKASLFG
jgi:hypothetical protein